MTQSETVTARTARWYDLFNRHAADLYPGRYTRIKVRELAELSIRIEQLAQLVGSTIATHFYTYPEFHELQGGLLGDSLGLARNVRDSGATRVDFQSVFFMGETAKIIGGDAVRVFVGDTPDVISCSLVEGTDHAWVERWRARHPDGIIITYVNSDGYTKSISDYICTSRNTDRVIAAAFGMLPEYTPDHAIPDRVLLLPDKYLGHVMAQRAAREFSVPTDRIDIYAHPHNGRNACCYVHEKIGADGPEQMLAEYPDAELLIHPECGCAATCLLKVHSGVIPQDKAYFLSTSQMLDHARRSKATHFLVGTELGMIYYLRKMLPEKRFTPVSPNALCDFMKANELWKLYRALELNTYEIVQCDDCCDPKRPLVTERTIHSPRSIIPGARLAIDRMLRVG